MIQSLREDFNRRFTEATYSDLLARLAERTGGEVPFRVAETPVFVPHDLMDRMVEAGKELTLQLVDDPAYMAMTESVVPPIFQDPAFFIPGQMPQPHFMTVDFGLVRGADGELEPKLVELQAFPSVYGFQDDVTRQYCESFELDRTLEPLLGGHDHASYWDVLRRTIVGQHDPENVVLTEIEPEQQKTRPDFRIYQRELGVRTVDITHIKVRGRKLFYEHEGREIPIHRIFNRAIADELDRKGITLPFDLRDGLDVEWAGHPSWFFRISKLSLPYLDHETVPPAVFLDKWFAGEGRERLPEDRERLLLKPLFSFAGKGIEFAPSDTLLAEIPEAERSQYLLQERMYFEPTVATPFGMTQAEIRILYVWPDGEDLQAISSLVRLGRGLMMGVDHNRDQRWVGGSAALCPSER